MDSGERGGGGESGFDEAVGCGCGGGGRSGVTFFGGSDRGESGGIFGGFDGPDAVDLDGGYGENEEASDGKDAKAKTAGGKDGFRGTGRKGFEHFWAEIEDGVLPVCWGLKFAKKGFGIEAEFAGVDAEEAAGVGEAGEFIKLACFKLAEDIVVEAGAGGSFFEGPTEAKACETELGAHGVGGFGG